jgi:hypothetical protein
LSSVARAVEVLPTQLGGPIGVGAAASTGAGSVAEAAA